MNQCSCGSAIAGILPALLALASLLFLGCIPGPPGLQGIQGPPGPQGAPGTTRVMALAGQKCQEGKFIIGFEENGNILCSGEPEQSMRVGIDCTNPPRLFPRANLQFCNLSGMNLSGTDLNHANLILANLHKTNLSASNLSGSNLSGASLIEANLEKANLSRTIGLNAQVGDNPQNSQKTNLSQARLQNTNLLGAFLVDTTITNVLWANTICPDGTNSNEDDGDSQTCKNNMIAMTLTVNDMPPIGKKGTVTNAFGIGVKATINCVTFNQDGSVIQTTTMHEVTLAPQETQAWKGNCSSVPPQFNTVTVQASPLLP